LSCCAPGQKLGDVANGHAKKVGQRPDDQNSSENHLESKIKLKIKIGLNKEEVMCPLNFSILHYRSIPYVDFLLNFDEIY
jgi:hypothetical protein